MRRTEGRGSIKIFEEFPRPRKGYWGGHFRARGYFCVTAGEPTEETVLQYLDRHFERNSNDRFDVEAPTGNSGRMHFRCFRRTHRLSASGHSVYSHSRTINFFGLQQYVFRHNCLLISISMPAHFPLERSIFSRGIHRSHRSGPKILPPFQRKKTEKCCGYPNV